MTTNSVTADLEGAQTLQIKLEKVTDDVKLKGGRFALRKAGLVLEEAVVGEMQRIDRERSREAIWRNVKLRFSPRKFQATGDLMFRLGILGGAKSKATNEKNPGGDTYYWRFLEFGTKTIPAQRNMTNAITRKQSEIISTFKREYGRALDRAIKKAAKAKA